MKNLLIFLRLNPRPTIAAMPICQRNVPVPGSIYASALNGQVRPNTAAKPIKLRIRFSFHLYAQIMRSDFRSMTMIVTPKAYIGARKRGL
jgi:hypothetical protein